MSKFCKFIKPNGEPCIGYKVTGSDYCFAHDPDPKARERLKRGRVKGGQRLKNPKLPKVELRTAEDIEKFLKLLLNDYRSGKITQTRVATQQKIADGILKAMEFGKLANRIGEIEEFIDNEDDDL